MIEVFSLSITSDFFLLDSLTPHTSLCFLVTTRKLSHVSPICEFKLLLVCLTV